MDAVDKLGREVSRAWSKARRSPPAFPAIAADTLQRYRDDIDATSIVHRVFRRATLVPQTSLTEAFGEPPITLYREKDFYVEALFWHTGTTGVHEHRFSGAFLVAEGGSLQTRFKFHADRTLDRGFALGDLSMKAVEVLHRGEVREIHLGGALIHSVFHLVSPSVTIVVRTPAQPGIEREYRYPHVALDPAARKPRTVKQLQLLTLIAHTGWGDYTGAACDAVASSDPLGGFLVASRARLHLSRADFEPVAHQLHKRHAAVAPQLLRVIEEERRKRLIVNLRHSVTRTDLRFFLGVLLNVPDPKGVLAALAQQFPFDSPRARLALLKRALAPLVRGYGRDVYSVVGRRQG